MTNNIKQRLVGYARVSTKLQENNQSIATQLESIRLKCIGDEYELVDCFKDVQSGGSMDNRKGLQDALKLIFEDNAADGIIVCYMDRLARNTMEFLKLVERFKEAGKIMVFMDQKIDTSTSSGQLVLTILAAVAQMQKDQTKEKSAAGRETLKAAGKRYAGQPPFGYRVVRDAAGRSNNELIENPVEQRTIAKIKQLSATGLNASEIATWLSNFNALCEPGTEHLTRTGKAWYPKVVIEILNRLAA